MVLPLIQVAACDKKKKKKKNESKQCR
jgi:hypothetical protein